MLVYRIVKTEKEQVIFPEPVLIMKAAVGIMKEYMLYTQVKMQHWPYWKFW